MSLEIKVSYASPCLFHNQTFIFKNCVYHVDKRIIKIAKGLFFYLIPPNKSHNKIFDRSAYSIPCLLVGFSEEILMHILTFFRDGKFSDPNVNIRLMKKLDQIGERYKLHLLSHYVKAVIELKTFSKIEDQLSLEDQLELAALQQKLEKFVELFNQLYASSYLSKRVFAALPHFQPSNFEMLIVQFIRPHFPDLYDPFVKNYCRRRQEYLEDALLLFKDQKLKFSCMAEISSIDRRIKWFETFWKTIPSDLIKKSIIHPLMEYKCLLQAKEWVIKTQDRTSALSLFNELIKNQQEEEASQLHFLTFSEEMSIVLKEEIKELDVPISRLTIPPIQMPEVKYFSIIDIIQKTIDQQVSDVKRFGYPNKKSSGKLIGNLGDKIKKEFNVEWSAELLLLVIRRYIQTFLQEYSYDIIEDIQKAHVLLRSHEKHFHPVLLENFQVLLYLFPIIEVILQLEFKSSSILQLLGKNQSILRGEKLFSEILTIARHLYCQAYSLQEEFIIQFVSKELYPYIIKQRHKSFPQPKESFIQRLETSFKEAGLGEKLSASQIELAISIYIRKGVEAVNFRYFFPNVDKLNIYRNINEAHMLLEIVEVLKTALKRDFPIDIMNELAPKVAELISNKAKLKHEVFIKSLQAYYCIFPPQKVKYKPYSLPLGEEENEEKEIVKN